jgi:hypothetical protein
MRSRPLAAARRSGCSCAHPHGTAAGLRHRRGRDQPRSVEFDVSWKPSSRAFGPAGWGSQLWLETINKNLKVT